MLKDVHACFIESGLRKFSALYGLDDILIGLVLLPHGKIAACFDSTGPVVGRTPVAYDHSVEAPLLPEDIGEILLVLSHVRSANLVVCGHYRLRLSLSHNGLKRGKINLALGSLIHFAG